MFLGQRWCRLSAASYSAVNILLTCFNRDHMHMHEQELMNPKRDEGCFKIYFTLIAVTCGSALKQNDNYALTHRIQTL